LSRIRKPGDLIYIKAGVPHEVVVTVLALFLVWRYRAAFAGLVQP
jgi:hypothetical protein